MIRDNDDARELPRHRCVPRAALTAFVLAGIFAGVGGVIMSLFVSGAYPEFADWTDLRRRRSSSSCWAASTAFSGPAVGTMILLALNDFVTRFTEYYGLALGIIILVFALGLRRGLLDVCSMLAPACVVGPDGVKPAACEGVAMIPSRPR